MKNWIVFQLYYFKLTFPVHLLEIVSYLEGVLQMTSMDPRFLPSNTLTRALICLGGAICEFNNSMPAQILFWFGWFTPYSTTYNFKCRPSFFTYKVSENFYPGCKSLHSQNLTRKRGQIWALYCELCLCAIPLSPLNFWEKQKKRHACSKINLQKN